MQQIERILKKKEIWPYPNKNDDEPGIDSQWEDRAKQCKEAGFTRWKDPMVRQKWEIKDTNGKNFRIDVLNE